MSTTTGIRDTDFVLIEKFGDKGIFTLNRAHALNALNDDMIKKFGFYIRKWKDTKSLILIKNNGGKAFCAGGDVISIVDGDKTGERAKFSEAYTLTYIISKLKIPYVAFIDGITMGGGIGLSVHGRYRIATENTVFAMPETAIGIYPDAGGSYFLPRLQGKLGYYLGLTGYRLKGQDVWHAGIATHYCESAKLAELERRLLLTDDAVDVYNVINDLCPEPQSEFTLSKYLNQINESFSGSTVEEILCNLEKDNSDWAKQTIKILRTVSPISLKITLHGYKIGAKSSLGECLQMEFRIIIRLLEDFHSDFYEGVRAMLIDKDKNPKWKPSQIEDVTEQNVLSFFRPLSNNQELSINMNLNSKL